MLAGCGLDAQPPSTDPPVATTVPTTAPSPTEPIATTPPDGDHPPDDPAPVARWDDPEAVVDLDGGWSVRACAGDAPLLCVDRGGHEAGSVEALAFPVDDFDSIDPDAPVDDQLRAFADGFVEALGSDRAQGCGEGYRFEPLERRPIVIAGLPGLAFGFEGALADGTPSELNLQYAAIHEDRILSIVAAAYDEGGCPGRDELSGFRSSDLAAFRPHLEALLPESPLPPVGP